MASRIHAPGPRDGACVVRTAVGSRVVNPDIAVSGCLPSWRDHSPACMPAEMSWVS